MSTFVEPPIIKLLNRLQQVKAKPSNLSNKQGLNQWQALCPAHADKTPSLSITECLDDTVLVKCWAGCTANEIVQAVGLTLKDLFKATFPPQDKACQHQHQRTGNHKRPSRQAIQFEQMIIQIADKQLNKRSVLTYLDQQRYQLALQRLKHLNR